MGLWAPLGWSVFGRSYLYVLLTVCLVWVVCTTTSLSISATALPLVLCGGVCVGLGEREVRPDEEQKVSC